MNSPGRIGRYCLSLAFNSSSAVSKTLASRPALIFFSLRAASKALSTSARTFERSSHTAILLAGRPVRRDFSSANMVMCTLPCSLCALGRYFQISSAVKTRMGAIKRTSALVIFQTVVCADRRDLLRAALVYSRSFSTS